MTEELRQVGDILKLKRQEKNLSLKEVENGTSIRESFLKAIEEGTITDQLSGIYAQGFVKQYALFLGLEVDQLIREFPSAFKMPGEKHEFTYGIGTLEKRGNQSGSSKWLPNLFWVTISIVVLLLAWYLVKALGLM